MVTGVRSDLRNPQRLTVPAIAAEAPAVVFTVLRAARAVQRSCRCGRSPSHVGS
jgi:hypothetical protein